ncbi:AAA family ATPase [Candidatus Poriferisocius sp.]|uniref:AAA family ATPase n=1 Tax=Candidatus Poriferisocius sp. TaxID=3101276 RepID=UPI003B026F08
MVSRNLVNRGAEAAKLRGLLDKGKPALALVYGRRRVGKTYLLTQLWPPEQVLYYPASSTAAAINRRVLIEEAARWSGQELRAEDHPTWRAVFRTLFNLRPHEPVVVVLDEFQYLADGESGLREIASELNAVWESGLSRSSGLLVALCGSAVSTLRALAAGGSPLYGRLDLQLSIKPFDYYDAGMMVARYSLRDRVRAYAAFGGMPANLAVVDDSRSVGENITELLLSPHGVVRTRLLTEIDQEEGLRNTARYRAVLAGIGLGARTVGEVASKMGQRVDTPLRRVVNQLEGMSYLVREANFGGSTQRYRLADPAARFHYGIGLLSESAVATLGAETAWRTRIEPEVFPTYVGSHVFEDVARQACRRWAPERGLPAMAEWGKWVGRDRSRREVEIDLAGRTLDGTVVTGSVKFRTRPAGARTYLDHVIALERLADSGLGWAREALMPNSPFWFISAGGFAPSFHEVADPSRQIICWSMNDLYPDQPITDFSSTDG